MTNIIAPADAETVSFAPPVVDNESARFNRPLAGGGVMGSPS